MVVKILDCTLRDGAYVVDSNFGAKVIKNIIVKLSDSNIDIIECGWLRDLEETPDSVLYNSPKSFKTPVEKKSLYALMFDYGRYNIDKIEPKEDTQIDIIRIAFYKKNLSEVYSVAKDILDKGYQVFLQPSNIIEYTERDLKYLCDISNQLDINAVYIVDTFGSMFPQDLNYFMEYFNKNLKDSITVGFHSHNNIQLSFALSIEFISKMRRNIIVDSSLAGIGRGAGNTKTELLLSYLIKQGMKYKIAPIWSVLETDIAPIKTNSDWEYTPQKGFQGLHNLHPNTETILFND